MIPFSRLFFLSLYHIDVLIKGNFQEMAQAMGFLDSAIKGAWRLMWLNWFASLTSRGISFWSASLQLSESLIKIMHLFLIISESNVTIGGSGLIIHLTLFIGMHEFCIRMARSLVLCAEAKSTRIGWNKICMTFSLIPVVSCFRKQRFVNLDS